MNQQELLDIREVPLVDKIIFTEDFLVSQLQTTVTDFRALVEDGKFPKARAVSGRKVWTLLDVLEWQNHLPFADNFVLR